LADPDGYIAHSDIPSGSPYGKGDWTDEWYYIYPDGTHTRHVRIYTGLAGQSLTVTDQTFQGLPPIREIPPNVVHEFQEDFIFGLKGRLPEDDIERTPITLIKLDGHSRNISYQPYPKDFGEFIKACIKVVNLKSRYRPFTISMPYGIENEPYPPEGDLPHTFQTWPRHPKGDGYSTSLGHTLNWWHYRRTENMLEQVYLSGMIDSEDPVEELTALAQSWLAYPRLQMDGLKMSYTDKTYDQTQRAYIISGTESGPRQLEFALGFEVFEEEGMIPISIVNPAFVIKKWGNARAAIKVNGKLMHAGRDLRLGYEESATGTDLIVWLKMKSDKTTRFSVFPIN
jgi:hypothetical protein